MFICDDPKFCVKWQSHFSVLPVSSIALNILTIVDVCMCMYVYLLKFLMLNSVYGCVLYLQVRTGIGTLSTYNHSVVRSSKAIPSFAHLHMITMMIKYLMW